MGGGGGSAGSVTYPEYIRVIHENWLVGSSTSGKGDLLYSAVELMSAGMSADPYAAAIAYDPDTLITEIDVAVNEFDGLVALLSSGTPLNTLVSNVLSTTRITAAVDAFEADLDDQLDTVAYPRFETGMRDINAVMTSAFAIGRSNIETAALREVEKMDAQIRLQAFGQDALRLIELKLKSTERLTELTGETRRLEYVMKKEEEDQQVQYDAKSALWDLELLQYGANMMAAPGGGTAMPGRTGPSTAQSALGGAMAGASIGAAVGPPGSLMGAGVGAVVGGIAGMLAR